jgi:putative Mn2+ efflux pump MntP
MDSATLLGIAFALGMDAFAVSVGVSTALGGVTGRQYFRLSWHFGLFQFLMPIAGWSLGRLGLAAVSAVDHWIAFAILTFIGAKMIRDSFRGEGFDNRPGDPTRGASLVVLSIATSIDALAAGLGMALLGMEIILPSVIIGVAAGCMTLVGMRFGSALGRRVGSGAEVVGGLVLIGLGLKILFENLAA